MALTTDRISVLRGRPPVRAGGRRGFRTAHCWLVRSLGYGFGFIPFLRSRPPFWNRLLERLEAKSSRQNEPIYERPVVKRGGADFVSQGSRTSPSPSASVDLAHLRPVRRRFSVHPATHPLSPRPRESFLPQCRQCTKR